mmetsp:Transcript_17799/g.25763  ORF Transcript_17799/g.25763 Transcript_17799/m.25763 type:complete len:266 (+) Transcript_17799:92-889(+)
MVYQPSLIFAQTILFILTPHPLQQLFRESITSSTAFVAASSIKAPSFVVHHRHTPKHAKVTVQPNCNKKVNICMSTSKLTSETADNNKGDEMTTMMRFGKFQISPSNVFYRTALSFAIVNLRPIVPGHVLIIPNRIVPRISQLTNDEYNDLWMTVRNVQNSLEKYYNAGGFNVAVQDGVVAGQSVPHVHVHILPRTKGDFERNDDVYDELEEWAPRKGDAGKVKTELEVLDDEDRKDRTEKEMNEEAELYRNLMIQNNGDYDSES